MHNRASVTCEDWFHFVATLMMTIDILYYTLRRQNAVLFEV